MPSVNEFTIGEKRLGSSNDTKPRPLGNFVHLQYLCPASRRYNTSVIRNILRVLAQSDGGILLDDHHPTPTQQISGFELMFPDEISGYYFNKRIGRYIEERLRHRLVYSSIVRES